MTMGPPRHCAATTPRHPRPVAQIEAHDLPRRTVTGDWHHHRRKGIVVAVRAAAADVLCEFEVVPCELA